VERRQNEIFLYWRKYDVPKQNILNQTGSFVYTVTDIDGDPPVKSPLFLYGIGYIFWPH